MWLTVRNFTLSITSKYFTCITLCNPHYNPDRSTINAPVLQMKKLKPREFKKLVQSDMATLWQSHE